MRRATPDYLVRRLRMRHLELLVSLSDGGTFVLDVGGRAHSLHVLGVDAGSTWDLYVGAWEAFNTDSRRVG